MKSERTKKRLHCNLKCNHFISFELKVQTLELLVKNKIYLNEQTKLNVQTTADVGKKNPAKQNKKKLKKNGESEN